MSSAEAVSALNWWSEAGVDTIVGEEPRDWLNPRAQKVSEAAALPPAPPPSIPGSLDAFQAWLATSAEVPGAAAGAARLGPAGGPAAKVMILTDVPAMSDFAAGQLVSSDGLFDRMLSSIELRREDVYIGSLLPFRPASGSIEDGLLRQAAELARHHIALVAPEALLLLGDSCAKALLGGSISQTRSRWHQVETGHGPVKAVATMKPEKLNLQPNLKKYAWEDLKLLREGLSE